MKLLYNTFTTEGKIEVMQRYIEDPAGLLIKGLTGDWANFHIKYSRTLSNPPSWNWDNYTYNYPAPEKKKVLKPWGFDNCPKGSVLVRSKDRRLRLYSVSGWSFNSIYVAGNDEIEFESLCKNWEYSFDGDNWAPCGIEVEE